MILGRTIPVEDRYRVKETILLENQKEYKKTDEEELRV